MRSLSFLCVAILSLQTFTTAAPAKYRMSSDIQLNIPPAHELEEYFEIENVELGALKNLKTMYSQDATVLVRPFFCPLS